MARKRPSRHSADQFALFLEAAQASLDKSDGNDFTSTLARLISKSDAGLPHGIDRLPPPEGAGPVLPERPPFEHLEQVARHTGDGRNALMQMIGQLVLSWSNNESLLIYVLMLLLATDEQSAAAVFAALNTTRARLELVRRIMMLKISDRVLRRDLGAVLERLGAVGRLRNEFLHSTYATNARGEITHTQAMRFVEKRDHLSFGDRRPLDERGRARLQEAIDELVALNRAIWDLLPRLKKAVPPPNR